MDKSVEKFEEDIDLLDTLSKYNYTVELIDRTFSHVTNIYFMDDISKEYIDIVFFHKGKRTFVRKPKEQLLGIYKLLE